MSDEKWEDSYAKMGSFLNDVARGNVKGASIFSAFGELVTTGAATGNLIWPIEGTVNIPVPVPAGVQMAVVSTNAADTAAGTGVRSVEIHYLDANLAEQVEIVTLNGVTPVNTVATDIRFINCMHMLTYGSGKAAAGNISASNGGTTYSRLVAGKRRCSSSARMVPAGKVLMLKSMAAGSASGAGAAKSIIRLVTTVLGNNDFTDDGLMIPHAGISLQDGAETLTMDMPFPIAGGTIVAMECDTDKAATIDAGWFGWLESA